MIVSLTTCPVCKGQLKLQELVTSVSKYICQTCVPDSFLPHYELHTNGSGGIQVFTLPPFIVYNNLNSNRSFIHQYGTQKQIMECTLLPFESAEKLIERIKSLVVFS